MANKKCPVCKKEVVEKYAPFCSKHCADVDLGRWFNESYSVEVEESQSSDGFDEQENEDF